MLWKSRRAIKVTRDSVQKHFSDFCTRINIDIQQWLMVKAKGELCAT